MNKFPLIINFANSEVVMMIITIINLTVFNILIKSMYL